MSNKDKRILDPEFNFGPRLINIGFGNYVRTQRVIAIVESGPVASRRLRDTAVKGDRLVDATAGRKMRSLIVTDSNHVLISALAASTLQERMQSPKNHPSVAQMELQDGEFCS